MNFAKVLRLAGTRLLAVAAFCAITASVQSETFKGMLISKTDGSTVALDMASDMETTVVDNNLVFSKGGTDVVTVPVAQVKTWKFSKTSVTGLSEVAVAEQMQLVGKTVIIDGLKAATPVQVISASGQTVLSTVATGRCELSLEGLAAGVYVISYNNQTLKIAVR